MKDKIINEIMTDCIAFLSPENCNKVKIILEEKLYNYNIQVQVTDIVPVNYNYRLVECYFASKIIEGLSKNTIISYSRELNKFIHWIERDIKEISAMDIRMYLASRKKLGIKDSSLSTIISILKSFYKWLMREEYILKNPMDKIQSIKINKYIRKPLSLEELELLRCTCKSLREKALLEVYYSTGARLEEILQLNKADINWNTGEIIVFGKGGKERKVYLNAKAKVHLWNYLNSRKDNDDALFVVERKITGRQSQRLGRRSVERIFSSLGKRAGIEKPVFAHRIRHTFATSHLQHGGSIVETQKLMGHSSPSTTLIYSQLDDDTIRISHQKNII